MEQERALSVLDRPYGLVDEHILGRVFAVPHPLSGGVLGRPAELSSVDAADARSYVAERLVPANAVLTVVGRFDPGVALRLIEDGLGRLPAGRRSAPPVFAGLSKGAVAQEVERISRRPRVTLSWRFAGLDAQRARALMVGAQLLTFFTDGAWGMRLSAGLAQYSEGALFRVDLQVPYDEPADAVRNDAEAFLRQLTLREMPLELIVSANLALDRAGMAAFDTLEGQALTLTWLELLQLREDAATFFEKRWTMKVDEVRDTARAFLSRPKVVVHARPTRPKPARVATDADGVERDSGE